MISRFIICSKIIAFCLLGTVYAAEWKTVQIGDQLQLSVEVVSSMREQALGLGNRFSVPEGTGMLFHYPDVGERIFWMKRMNFAIDIIWIQKGKIVHIEQNVLPPPSKISDRMLKRYGIGVLANMILEVPAGYCQKKSIHINDFIKLLP